MRKLTEYLRGFQKNYEGEIIIEGEALIDLLDIFALSTVRKYANRLGWNTKLVDEAELILY